MRLPDTDRFRRDYVMARDARFAIRSLSFAIEGTSSGCCGAPTYERADQSWCCRCDRMCKTKFWRAPKSGAVCRGGWDTILIRETRTVRGDAEELRRALGWERIRHLEPLFVVPESFTRGAWEWRCEIWDLFLDSKRGGYERAAERCALNADTVRDFVGTCRRIVRDRYYEATIGRRAA